jgi:hypothetical protein
MISYSAYPWQAFLASVMLVVSGLVGQDPTQRCFIRVTHLTCEHKTRLDRLARTTRGLYYKTCGSNYCRVVISSSVSSVNLFHPGLIYPGRAAAYQSRALYRTPLFQFGKNRLPVSVTRWQNQCIRFVLQLLLSKKITKLLINQQPLKLEKK